MSINFYFIVFIVTFILSVIFSRLVIFLAKYLNILDRPDGQKKLHATPTPLLGGVAIFLSFFSVAYLARDYLLAGNLETRHWLGVFIGALILMIGGFLDDKYNLKPKQQFIFPLLAIFSVIVGGVGIEKITNPFGGYFYLGWLSSVLIFFWLLGMMYTTKLLDGLDGLVSGVVSIGALIIFLFTITTKYYQPDIGLAALILCASTLGFLFFNWNPAKIFLGEGGALFLGYLLGVLAIISGGKIAIALLIMGIPILDVAWTIVRRLAIGKNPFQFSDRKHLHHRLLDSGLGVKKTVLLFYLFSAIFGGCALLLQSKGKLLALGVLLVLMIIIVWRFSKINKNGF